MRMVGGAAGAANHRWWRAGEAAAEEGRGEEEEDRGRGTSRGERRAARSRGA